MPAPSFELFLPGSTPSSGTKITSASQIDFGTLEAGVTSATLTVDLWNDRNGVNGSDLASPRLNAFPLSPSQAEAFAGTAVNGNVSMLEARSCGAYGVAGDYQSDWSPLSAMTFLELGDMPSNSKRILEIRMRIPSDCDPITLASARLQVHY